MKTYARLAKEEEREARRRILFIEEVFEGVTGFSKDVILNSYCEGVYRFRELVARRGVPAAMIYLVYEGGALVNVSYGVKSCEDTRLPLKLPDKQVSKDIKELSSGFLIGVNECRSGAAFAYNVFSSQSGTILFALDHEVGPSQADRIQARSQR